MLRPDRYLYLFEVRQGRLQVKSLYLFEVRHKDGLKTSSWRVGLVVLLLNAPPQLPTVQGTATIEAKSTAQDPMYLSLFVCVFFFNAVSRHPSAHIDMMTS